MAAMMLTMTEKSDSHVYQLPEGMKGGMTLDRCSEIQKALHEQGPAGRYSGHTACLPGATAKGRARPKPDAPFVLAL